MQPLGWFNSGTSDDELEHYGIKVVDDVTKFILEGDIADEEVKHQQFLDWTIGKLVIVSAM